ncbi:peptidase [Prevotella intermedia]|uniref:Peptidase n=2 Tax=Prevotella intermedia TaxID=28131 RepID=A0AAJ3RIS0_PREIN|nr:peptidase [Prevotella intermedia]PIK17574.1 peptidase [Prevotella intermedia]
MFAMPTTTKAQVAYDLAVAGKKVTSANCNDLSVIEGVRGTVSYDPTANVLTLQNAEIITEGNINAIYSKIDGMTLKVIGINKLKAHKAAITLRNPMTINGGGTLKVESEKDCAIFLFSTDLTIENCTVEADSEAYGIAGVDGTTENLTIKNAEVEAEGKEGGSIRDLATLTLIGCNITKPAGAAFDASLHGVVLNGEIVKTEVEITKDATAIATPTAQTTATAAQGNYTISGVRLSDELQNLSKGIYIVNGKKVVKQ